MLCFIGKNHFRLLNLDFLSLQNQQGDQIARQSIEIITLSDAGKEDFRAETNIAKSCVPINTAREENNTSELNRPTILADKRFCSQSSP
jgi:hypothetical protein